MMYPRTLVAVWAAAATPVWTPPVQVWTGKMVAVLAIGAEKPTSAAVAMAKAKARLFPDILYFPHLICLILHAGSA
jgi:hypothetical protein